ncbi:MAG TPA: uroporphyrinogen-III synthase [Candidatus Acidoferrum sp.]|nr:uroporphyrinogen-III synthase [Candidatus Acidoferrum sp.]
MAEASPNVLAGKRIVITRSAAQSEALARELSARGAIPVVLPLVSFADPEDFAPLDAAIAEIQRFDWMILTSAQAVRAVVKRGEELKLSLIRSESKLRIAAVGPVTAEAARQAGLPVEYAAETHTGAALAEELGNRLQGAKVFLPRSDRANPDLPPALKRHGAHVTEVIAYRTLRATDVDQRKLGQIAAGAADAVLFFSPSAVQYFAALFGGEQLHALQDKLAITAVGPVTANALREAGIRRTVLAADTTAVAVVEALEEHFAGTVKQAQAGAKKA